MSHDFNLHQCNPSTLTTTRTTCLPHDMILRLRDAWNDRFPAHAIPTHLRTKEKIWMALRRRMRHQYQCASEYCAVKKLGRTEDHAAAARFFRPEQPESWDSNPTEWHDTLTIAMVMEQYEEAFPHFEFIGPVPIDFDAKLPGHWDRCVSEELCRLDLASLRRRGTEAIGIVFNLDPHDKPGSHWVCAYLDLKGSAAYYYDSYGYEPCAEIRRLLRRARDQGIRSIYWNDIRHQRKKSECGTYCMYVIISLLKGRSFRDICENRVDDDTMNAFRDIFYATEKPRPTAVVDAVKLLKLG